MPCPHWTEPGLPFGLNPNPPHPLPTSPTSVERTVAAKSLPIENEAQEIWSLFLNWRLLAIISGVVLAWLLATQFYIQPSGYVIAFAVAGAYWRIGLSRDDRGDAARRRPLSRRCHRRHSGHHPRGLARLTF
jgi:hypothetical protein